MRNTDRKVPPGGGVALAVIVGAALLVLSSCVFAADTYVTVGYGNSVLNHNGQDNLWYQERFPYAQDENSRVKQLGIGFRLTGWMSAEITYHDFGTYRLTSDFVGDDALYQPQSETGCLGVCPQLFHSRGIGTAKGVSMTVLPELNAGAFGAFARIGAIYFDAKYHQYMRTPDTNYAYDIDALSTEGGMNKRGISPVYGGGLRWTPAKGHDITAEYVNYPMVRGHLSAFNSVQTKTINYRYWF